MNKFTMFLFLAIGTASFSAVAMNKKEIDTQIRRLDRDLERLIAERDNHYAGSPLHYIHSEDERNELSERAQELMNEIATLREARRSAPQAPKKSIKDQEARIKARLEQRKAEQVAAVAERRHSFVDTLRKYKAAMAATATAAVAGAVASTSQVIDCAQVAQAVCNGQVVSQTALQVCNAHIPNALSCFLGYF